MTSNQKSIRVLLVEDEDFTRNMVSEMLASAGITLNSVKSVTHALSVIDDFDPHVVLTDLDLGHGPDGNLYIADPAHQAVMVWLEGKAQALVRLYEEKVFKVSAHMQVI